MDFTCKGCSLSFKDQFAFFIHFFSNLCIAKQRESTEKENRTILDVKHLRTNESNVCEVCGKFCWPYAGLAKHILTHVGAMPYFCPFCHFSSLSKLHLQAHISSHSSRGKNGVQKFPSNLNHVCDSCNCAFTDWKDLAVHYVKHLKEAPFKCNICCMMFLDKDDFNIHRHLHKISPFCEFCQLSFNNRPDCLEHVLTHNKSKMFRKFSLVVPYERLMKLKTSWYHDFFTDPSICDQHLLDNSGQLHNFHTEENDSANFENQKDGKLLYLNNSSAQPGPSPLIDNDVRENIVHLCEATSESGKEDENRCSLSEKCRNFDDLNGKEKAIDISEYSNNMKISSENELDSDIICTSDVCFIETESTKSSVHLIKGSNTKQTFKTSDCLVRLPNTQDIEACRNFCNVPSQELKVNLHKSWKEANFKSTILNTNSLVSKNWSNDKQQLSHRTLHKSAVSDYDYYSMQITSSHSKPMFDYSVRNNHKIDEVEIRENVSHLCEVIFEEGEEDISFNCGLSKKFIKCCSTSERTSETSLNLFKFSNVYETSAKRKLNGNITLTSAEDQNNLIKVLNNYNKQQLNFCKDTNSFYENESEKGVSILSSTAEEKFSDSTLNKANKMNCLIDLVKNLKDVFVVLEKLPNYVHDMSSFRKYKNVNNNANKQLCVVYPKDSKSRLRTKNSISQRVKKKNFKTNACSTFSDSSLFNTFTFSKSFKPTDEMLHCSLVKSRGLKLSGSDKNKTYSKTKRTISQSSIKSIFQESEVESSTTESSETDSDSFSDISDFMHRWLLNSPQNSDKSPKNTISRTKKSVVKLCQKQPRKHSSQLHTSLNSIQMKKPFVHLWKLPDYIYEKHQKGKPIMLSNLSSIIEKTEYDFQKQQVTSQVLHDHSYCLPSVSCSFLEHGYS